MSTLHAEEPVVGAGSLRGLAPGPCQRVHTLPRSTGPASQAGAPFPLEQACQTSVYEACGPWATSLTCLL